MKKLSNLKKKSKTLTILIGVVAVILVFLIAYYAGNGFSLNDLVLNTHDDCRIVLSSPDNQDVFYGTETIDIRGSMWGGIPKKVLVWDERYNVPISCSITGSYFDASVIAGDISNGYHNLCIQGQTDDGRWTAVEKVTIEKRQAGIIGAAEPDTWSESFFPEPVAMFFRPVEEVLSHVVVYVTGGTSNDDLNGDNIPDEIEQSPVSPRQNPMNVPLSTIIIFTLIIVVILVVVMYVARPYVKHRISHERRVTKSPKLRKWSLEMKKKKEAKLQSKLRAERMRRINLEKKLKKEKEHTSKLEKRRPVNIFFDKKSNKSVEEVKE